MAIGPADIKFYKSLNSSGGNICLGGGIDLVSAALNKNDDVANPIFNQVFRDFTDSERENGFQQCHCIFVRNEHATLTWTNIKMWFSAVTPNPATFTRMGMDPAGLNNPATTISNVMNEPPGVDLETRHNAESESIALPNLPPNGYVAIWILIELRPNGVNYPKDFFEIRIDGTTAA
jgi:hypothetical protein